MWPLSTGLSQTELCRKCKIHTKFQMLNLNIRFWLYWVKSHIFIRINFTYFILLFKNVATRPHAGVVRWIECWPENQRVMGLIPSQGTSLGFRPGPQ